MSTRSWDWLAVIAFSTAACAEQGEPAGPAGAVVTGRIAAAEYQLDTPSVVAEDTDGGYFIAKVGDDGSFSLDLPSDGTYRFSVAEGANGGAFVTVSRIRLPWDDALWASFEHGSSLDLGEVHREHGAEDDHPHAGLDDQPGVGVPACAPQGRAREADLPYDVKLSVGDTFRLSDAFLEKGEKPAAVLGVTMEDGDWRLAALSADTTFVVTAEDCAHEGNRDVGRDRVFVTWQNADGSVETDHLDLRYCEGGGAADDASGSGSGGSGSGHSGGSDDDAGHDAGDDDGPLHELGDDDSDDCGPGKVRVPVCAAPVVTESRCDGATRMGVNPAAAPSSTSEPSCELPPVAVPPVQDVPASTIVD